MTNDELEQEVKEIVATILESPSGEINPDADFFKDLGVDSMGALEITASIEKKFKTLIPEEQIPNIRTVNQAIALIKKLLGSRVNG